LATQRVACQHELACGTANCALQNGPPACLGAHDVTALMRIRAGHQEPPRRDREVVVAKTFHFPLPLVSRSLFPQPVIASCPGVRCALPMLTSLMLSPPFTFYLLGPFVLAQEAHPPPVALCFRRGVPGARKEGCWPGL
jgi:hypothetical protein